MIKRVTTTLSKKLRVLLDNPEKLRDELKQSLLQAFKVITDITLIKVGRSTSKDQFSYRMEFIAGLDDENEFQKKVRQIVAQTERVTANVLTDEMSPIALRIYFYTKEARDPAVLVFKVWPTHATLTRIDIPK